MALKYVTISFPSSQFLIVFITWGMYTHIGLDAIYLKRARPVIIYIYI